MTGTQGVLIPKKNVSDLNLAKEIVENVKNGKFHIYTFSHIDEGIEILSEISAGKWDETSGKFEENTFHSKVWKKLEEFSKIPAKKKNVPSKL